MSSIISYGRTGDLPRTTVRTVNVPFNQYEVLVAVTETGQIICIQEIRVKKDFRKPSQIGAVDFDQYYRD